MSAKTVKKITTHLNILKDAVRKYEESLSEPSISTLLKLSNIFNVSLDSLLGNTEMADKIKYLADQMTTMHDSDPQRIVAMAGDSDDLELLQYMKTHNIDSRKTLALLNVIISLNVADTIK